MIQLQTVQLRNGMLAQIHPTAIEGLPWRHMGKDSTGVTHLWATNGCWREDGSPHPFDIRTANVADKEMQPVQ